MRRRPSRRSLKNTVSFDLDNATDSEIVEEYKINMQTHNMQISQEKLAKDSGTSDSWSDEPAILEINAAVDEKEQLGPLVAIESTSVDSDVFDKLSKTLEEHASLLANEDRQKEHVLRGQVVDSLRSFHTDRFSLGKSLFEYKSVFKSQRQWTRVAVEIGAVIQVSSRTVFRMIDDYKSSNKGLQPSATLDTTAIQGEQLSSRERNEIRARLAIRAMLDDIPDNQKAAALGEILAEEAYQIWGKREKFSINVIPKESRYTIDGRKKGMPQATSEVAA